MEALRFTVPVSVPSSIKRPRAKKRNSLIVPSSISEEAQRVLEANKHVLWDIALFYSPNRQELPSPSAVTPPPPFNTTPPKQIAKIPYHFPLLPAEALCSLAKDWGLCPAMCGKPLLMDMVVSVLENQEWEWEEAKISFNQFQKIIYMIALRLDGFPRVMSEEDRMKFLLRVMDNSDGRKRRLQSRNALNIPKFVNIDFLRSLQPTPSDSNIPKLMRTKSCELNISRTKTISIKSLPKLLGQNQLVLWTLFKCYALCYSDSARGLKRSSFISKITKEATVTGSTARSDSNASRSSHKLSEDAVWNLLRDFDVIPTICSKSYLKTAISEVLSGGRHLAFLEFLILLNKIALSRVQSTTGLPDDPDCKLNALLTAMDKSEGRLKFVQLARNASILPPFVLNETDSKNTNGNNAPNSAISGAMDDTETSLTDDLPNLNSRVESSQRRKSDPDRANSPNTSNQTQTPQLFRTKRALSLVGAVNIRI
eukprot:CAMPEP_0182439898 /NCGR_PEP_ID=MMETSP1167-20130531/86718_1 /TAXON_ID=2988 /ORGANISM="Mallomonas Sp, Strain CCMP3275" /LENGTH=481 /DNA_ID=CAMNT_0024633699 /DNA_START=670 /DNA_END=2115 /DNA_ORIENTATION=-